MTKIYLITNIDNNPYRVYIGKTKNNRKNDHRKTFKGDWEYHYIDEVNSLNVKDWKPLECYWIEQFKQWGFEVLNNNKGGGGPSYQPQSMKDIISQINTSNQYNLGNKQTEETIDRRFRDINWVETGRKISEAKVGHECYNDEWRNKLKKPKPQGFMDETHRDKIRQSQTGVSKEKTKKPITQLSKDNIIIKEWTSQTEASIALGIKQGDISAVLHNNQKTAGGYKFKFKCIKDGK